MGRTTRAAAVARSISRISALRALCWRLRPTLLLTEILVPVEDRVAPEQGDHAAEREERPQRNRLLARILAVPHEEDAGRDERDEEPDEHRDDDRDPEPGAQEG